MHDEQALACAAALAFDNFGLARCLAENTRSDDEDLQGTRAWSNGSLFCELMRLQAADADNIVMKACQMDVIDLFAAGGYLEWLAALKLPASNRQRINTAKACAEMTNDQEYAHKIIPKQREKVETWLRDTECLTDPDAVAKEVLVGRRRAAFDEAVNALVRMQKVTAAAVRKHLAEYQKACKELEDARQSSPTRPPKKKSGASGSGASTSGNGTPPTEEANPLETRNKPARVCEHCQEPAKDGAKLKKCSKCNKARYCGAQCQKLAWRAGHKETCRGITTPALEQIAF
ncbi:hypothetical protein KFL_000460040 [Klebsormidium nitens]|uniref:MYND-type domain-containing protein n=1 Tax=Klebsormidium nitens TaxID=105231 RepID=A0A1Y1HQM3_KLENI|nr:hypothetical protein KFL_000460040 [Klebsormidium nitens]|eukprot:GAQ80092.1 hypothetical protein KFL_000460040 [Klebsormidium nitens]